MTTDQLKARIVKWCVVNTSNPKTRRLLEDCLSYIEEQEDYEHQYECLCKYWAEDEPGNPHGRHSVWEWLDVVLDDKKNLQSKLTSLEKENSDLKVCETMCEEIDHMLYVKGSKNIVEAVQSKLTESDKLLREAVELLTRATANHVQSFIKPSDWRKRRDALLEKLKEAK